MKVVKASNLPSRPPTLLTLVTLLSLDHWQASDTVKGIFYAILAIVWVASIVLIVKEDQVDIFKEK